MEVTQTLAKYLVSSTMHAIPDSVKHDAKRTLLNWIGCAIGGCRHETVDIAIETLAPYSGPAQASILGRKERFDIFHSALINGISSHVLDFDDTHLKTIIHPAGPVASAILALGEHKKTTGTDLIHALILGIETECRIGNAVYPAHYKAGWHITGTTGVFGAAAAAGKLLQLNEQQMTWALGIAATQPVGMQEMFGSMTKSFHPGRSAQNGLTAALLAAKNYTSTNQALEAKYGWGNLLSTDRDYSKITDGLGETFEISLNTYKPFPCGIVIHPVIDGCIQIHDEHHLAPETITRVELTVHPLVLQLTGKKAPQLGLEGKFSVYHAASIALITGKSGVDAFTDRAVQDPAVVALRDRVTAEIGPETHEDQARIVVTTKDGRRIEKYVEHAVGSLERPMSDAQLEAKFSALAAGTLPPEQTSKALEMCWKIDRLPEVSALTYYCVAKP